ncbi:SLIT and NTRK-like protein 4 isoform X1 [Folsomia candida]|uniref:SLIT and NTRK-like protein 4 isoform X1 n=1 Tax=Folsomia candida TaxID=158441 RepID=UPI0016050673|nr:SLIT and NTRK-like protein 4 isoform X1 [Folsomia candida]
MAKISPLLYLFLLSISTSLQLTSACTCTFFQSPSTLRCSNCTEIPSYHDPRSITHLDLSSGSNTLTNALTSNTFINKGFFTLKHINLSHTEIGDIDMDAFLGIKELREVTLDLSYNSISFLRMTRFTNPKVLNLRGNPIESLDLGWLATELSELDLSNCSLTKIPPGAPFINSHLARINLDSNRLTSLPWTEIRNMNFLKELSLKDNPWRCDCQMYFLREYLLNRRGLDISSEVVCASPPELKGRRLSSIPMGELYCPLENKGLIGDVSEDMVRLQCLTEGLKEPEVEWHQGTLGREDLLVSQPGISIYNVPLPTPENYRQLHRFRWESVLEISANNSAYEGPWQFWCTAKNMYGIRSRELSLTRPTPTAQPLPRQPVYIRSTPAPKEIVTQ